jgi:hypothetical protein
LESRDDEPLIDSQIFRIREWRIGTHNGTVGIGLDLLLERAEEHIGVYTVCIERDTSILGVTLITYQTGNTELTLVTGTL